MSAVRPSSTVPAGGVRIASAGDATLPAIVESSEEQSAGGLEALLALWGESGSWIEEQLYQRGAVLFRGFAIAGPNALRELIERLGLRRGDYIDGNSPRRKLDGQVYTSTEFPPEFFISMHNELSYSSRWPARLFFSCETPAATGGETPLLDGRLLLERLPGDLVDAFRTRGVRYLRRLHGGTGIGPSWQQTFETTDCDELAARLRDLGGGATWQADGTLLIEAVRPATATHPVTGEEVWFNQADQFHPSTHPPAVLNAIRLLYRGREDLMPINATFGDGSPIPLEQLEAVRQCAREHMVCVPWRRGDLLMVDNMLTLHGRMPFAGPRRILVAMTDAPSTADSHD